MYFKVITEETKGSKYYGISDDKGNVIVPCKYKGATILDGRQDGEDSSFFYKHPSKIHFVLEKETGYHDLYDCYGYLINNPQMNIKVERLVQTEDSDSIHIIATNEEGKLGLLHFDPRSKISHITKIEIGDNFYYILDSVGTEAGLYDENGNKVQTTPAPGRLLKFSDSGIEYVIEVRNQSYLINTSENYYNDDTSTCKYVCGNEDWSEMPRNIIELAQKIYASTSICFGGFHEYSVTNSHVNKWEEVKLIKHLSKKRPSQIGVSYLKSEDKSKVTVSKLSPKFSLSRLSHFKIEGSNSMEIYIDTPGYDRMVLFNTYRGKKVGLSQLCRNSWGCNVTELLPVIYSSITFDQNHQYLLLEQTKGGKTLKGIANYDIDLVSNTNDVFERDREFRLSISKSIPCEYESIQAETYCQDYMKYRNRWDDDNEVAASGKYIFTYFIVQKDGKYGVIKCKKRSDIYTVGILNTISCKQIIPCEYDEITSKAVLEGSPRELDQSDKRSYVFFNCRRGDNWFGIVDGIANKERCSFTNGGQGFKSIKHSHQNIFVCETASGNNVIACIINKKFDENHERSYGWDIQTINAPTSYGIKDDLIATLDGRVAKIYNKTYDNGYCLSDPTLTSYDEIATFADVDSVENKHGIILITKGNVTDCYNSEFEKIATVSSPDDVSEHDKLVWIKNGECFDCYTRGIEKLATITKIEYSPKQHLLFLLKENGHTLVINKTDGPDYIKFVALDTEKVEGYELGTSTVTYCADYDRLIIDAGNKKFAFPDGAIYKSSLDGKFDEFQVYPLSHNNGFAFLRQGNYGKIVDYWLPGGEANCENLHSRYDAYVRKCGEGFRIKEIINLESKINVRIIYYNGDGLYGVIAGQTGEDEFKDIPCKYDNITFDPEAKQFICAVGNGTDIYDITGKKLPVPRIALTILDNVE